MVFDKVLLIGNGRIADDCLRIMVKKSVPVTFIEIFSEKFSFTEKLCERLSVPFRHYGIHEIKDFLLSIEEKTLIISAHNSYIFPKEVCSKENLTIINLHIAFLPEYRGMNPSTWAIFNQEQYSGVTWHTVSSRIDNGGIIVQKRVEIGADETAMKLMLRCFQEGVRLFDENLDSFISGTFSTFIPDDPNTRLYLASELPNEGYIDDSWGIEKIYAFLRSMDYSGSDLMRLPRIRYDNHTYEITKYKMSLQLDFGVAPEKVIDKNDGTLLIRSGPNCLSCSLREITEA